MRLLVINPNTNPEMTERIRRTAVDAAARAADIDMLRPRFGPESIEGQFDEVVSAYATLDAVLPLLSQYDGFVIACFSHHPVTGALRELVDGPVLGIMEASILHALPLGHRFSIVTTSARWKPLLEEGVRLLGVESRCASVRSSGLAVLDLERLPEQQIKERLCAEARLAVESDGAEVICLGCAGMAGLEGAIRSTVNVPVIDGVRAAVWSVISLVRSEAATSKRNLYSPVPPEPGFLFPSPAASGQPVAATETREGTLDEY